VPVVLRGITELIWGMDAMKHEYTGKLCHPPAAFLILVIGKAEVRLELERLLVLLRVSNPLPNFPFRASKF
jgi:hypothetical protein